MASKPGRPTSLTPERQERILSALAAGNTRHAACLVAPIGWATFTSWMHRGAEGQEPFATFRVEVKKAEKLAELAHVANIMRAGQEAKHWTASAWWLERKNPKHWGKKDTIQVDLTAALRALSDDELRARHLAALERAKRNYEKIGKASDPGGRALEPGDRGEP